MITLKHITSSFIQSSPKKLKSHTLHFQPQDHSIAFTSLSSTHSGKLQRHACRLILEAEPPSKEIFHHTHAYSRRTLILVIQTSRAASRVASLQCHVYLVRNCTAEIQNKPLLKAVNTPPRLTIEDRHRSPLSFFNVERFGREERTSRPLTALTG